MFIKQEQPLSSASAWMAQLQVVEYTACRTQDLYELKFDISNRQYTIQTQKLQIVLLCNYITTDSEHVVSNNSPRYTNTHYISLSK